MGVMADGAISGATELSHSAGKSSAEARRPTVKPGLLPGKCPCTCRAFSFLRPLEWGQGGKEERVFGGRDIIGCPFTKQQHMETCLSIPGSLSYL